MSQVERPKESEENIALSNIACGGLIAIGLVMLQAFIALTSLDSAEFISVLAFAIAIPLLTGRILQNFLVKLSKKDRVALGCSNTYYLGTLAALVGIGAAFWHVSYVAGIVFISSSFVAFAAFLLQYISIHEKTVV